MNIKIFPSIEIICTFVDGLIRRPRLIIFKLNFTYYLGLSFRLEAFHNKSFVCRIVHWCWRVSCGRHQIHFSCKWSRIYRKTSSVVGSTNFSLFFFLISPTFTFYWLRHFHFKLGKIKGNFTIVRIFGKYRWKNVGELSASSKRHWMLLVNDPKIIGSENTKTSNLYETTYTSAHFNK